MIVVTLVATAIKSASGMVLSECGMQALHDGDKLHCTPDLASRLVARYKDNLEQQPYWDRPGTLEGGTWALERAVVAPKLQGATAVPPEPAKAPERRTGRARTVTKEATT